LYDIELGRRDSLTSYAPSSETFLPAFNLKVSGLLEDFKLVGLDLVDLVVLSGQWVVQFSPPFHDIHIQQQFATQLNPETFYKIFFPSHELGLP
jgi:hypothetical protein